MTVMQTKVCEVAIGLLKTIGFLLFVITDIWSEGVQEYGVFYNISEE